MTNQFTLNSDQIAILETANQFGKKELYPLLKKWIMMNGGQTGYSKKWVTLVYLVSQ